MNKRVSEKGQALVLIVLAIVGIFGFAALALDIGKVYSERRRAQNAADAAVLDAGFTSTRTTGSAAVIEAAAYAAARASLAKNGYVNNPGIIDIDLNHRTEVDSSSVTHNYYDVTIHQVVDKIFSQFVYSGPLEFTVTAEAHLTSGGSISGPDAIRVLSPDSCGALFLDGGNTINIKGGNLSSDSTAGNCTGRPPETRGASCTSGVQNGTGVINITNGSLNLSGEWRAQSHSGTVNYIGGGSLNTCLPQRPFTPPQKPDCNGLTVYNTGSYSANGTLRLPAGSYPHGIKVTGNNTDIQLDPGLYCLGDDFSMTNGNLDGNGVMFYMAGGNFNVSGGTVANLIYGSDILDGAGKTWSGLLIYMPEENTSQVIIGGGSSSSYTGTILAPGLPPNTNNPDSQYKCIIGGNGTSMNVKASLICFTLKITGTAQLTIDYDPNLNMQAAPAMDLYK